MSKKEKNKLNVNILNRLNEEDESQAISDNELNASDLNGAIKNKANQDGADGAGQDSSASAANDGTGLGGSRAAKLFPILPYCNLNLIMDAKQRLEHLEQLLIDRLVLNEDGGNKKSGNQRASIPGDFSSASSTALISSYLSPLSLLDSNSKELEAGSEKQETLLDLNNLCLSDECLRNFRVINLVSMKTLEEKSETSDSDDQLTSKGQPADQDDDHKEVTAKHIDLTTSQEYLSLVENSKKIQHVNLSRNSLRYLPLNLLEIFVNLQYIDLSENSFEQIGLLSFVKFNSLKEINLSTNFLTSFKAILDDAELKGISERSGDLPEESEESAISLLSQGLFNNLERLNLSNNKLKCSSCLILAQFRNLKYLNLSNNNFQISTAPLSSSTTTNINTVMLAQQQQPPADMILFPWQKSTVQMKSLIELNLSKNNKPMSSTDSFVSLASHGTSGPVNQTRTEVRISSSLSQTSQLQRLSGIRPRTFSNLTNLRILNLSENNLYNVPNDIKDLKFLEELYLDHNNLEFIPSELSDLRMLKVLSLNDNKLVEVTENFCSYSRFKMGIEKLFLSKNQLKNQTLSNRLVLFESLKHLDLSENQFDQVPNALPIYLEILNMNKNKIKTLMIRPLPVEARQDEEMMSALKLVSTRMYEDPLLFGNEARQNEESIYDQPDVDQQEELVMPHVFYLRNLKRLEISDNYLQDIPSDFGILNSNLEYIDLSNNLLTHVSMSLCRGLANLKRLNLSSNKIRELPDKIRELSDLEYLDLSKNRLSSLNFELCNELKNLKELYLSNNFLEDLPLYSSNRRNKASRSNAGSAKKKSSQMRTTLNSSVDSVSMAAQKATTAKSSIVADDSTKASSTPSSSTFRPKNRFTFGLSNLKKVDLSSNRFKSGISLYTAFALSSNVEEINLSSNRITSIEVDNLNELALLAELAQDQNQQLPNEEQVQNLNSKYKLSRLRSLNLSNNQLAFTRGGFTRLLCNLYKLAPNLKAFFYDQANGSKLGVFDLESKDTQPVNPAPTSLTSHKNSSPIKGKDSSPVQMPQPVQLNEDYYFELEETEPTEQPAAAENVTNLENDAKLLPKPKNQLYEAVLERLEILDLSNNGLKKLPGLIYRFKNLKEIYLNGNLLRKIPHEMYEVKLPVQEEVVDKKPALPDKKAAHKDENDENEFFDEEFEKPKKKKGKKKKQKEEPVVKPEIKVVVKEEQLPPSKPLAETIEVLSLNDNQIESVPDTLFSNFKRLKEIKLLNNPLKDPPQESVCISAKFTRNDRLRSSSAFKLNKRNKDNDQNRPLTGSSQIDDSAATSSTVITLLDKTGQSKSAPSSLTTAPKLKVNAFDLKKINEDLLDNHLSSELNLPNLFFETNENLKSLQSYMLKYKKREDMLLCNMFMIIKDNIDSLETLYKLMRRLKMPMDKVQLACKEMAENITKNWSKIAAVEFAPKPGELSLSRKELNKKMHQYILKIQTWNMLNSWRNTFGAEAQSDEIIRIFKLMNSNQYENALYEKLISLKYNTSLFKV